MSVIVPKPNEIIKANLINPRILLLYGPPKIGKTTIASQLPDSLLIDLEDGSGFLDATKVKVTSLNELVEVGKSLIKDKFPFKYLFIDTATELESWCEEDATEQYKNSIIGSTFKGGSVLELPKGAGYYWIRKSYGTYFKAISTWAKHLIVIAHVKDKMLVDKKGREVEASDLDLTGKLKQITCSKADAIGFLYRKVTGAEEGKQTSELRVNFTTKDISTGARSKHLINQDFVFDWNKIFLPE